MVVQRLSGIRGCAGELDADHPVPDLDGDVDGAEVVRMQAQIQRLGPVVGLAGAGDEGGE